MEIGCAIFGVGGVPFLLSALLDQANDEDIQLQGCAALMNFAVHNNIIANG